MKYTKIQQNIGGVNVSYLLDADNGAKAAQHPKYDIPPGMTADGFTAFLSSCHFDLERLRRYSTLFYRAEKLGYIYEGILIRVNRKLKNPAVKMPRLGAKNTTYDIHAGFALRIFAPSLTPGTFAYITYGFTDMRDIEFIRSRADVSDDLMKTYDLPIITLPLIK